MRLESKDECSAARGDLDVPIVGLKVAYGLVSGGDIRVEIDGRRFMVCGGEVVVVICRERLKCAGGEMVVN